MTRRWVLILALTLTSAPAVLGAVFLGVGGGTEKCQEKCKETFNLHTNEQDRNEVDSCMTGCRVFSIIETVDKDADRDMQSHQDNCVKSCAKSFAEDPETKACNMGCEFQMPFAKERREQLSKSVDSELALSLPVLHRIQVSIPNFDSFGMPSFFGPDSDFDGMFDQMRNKMKGMMGRMMQGMKGMDMENMPTEGRGQMGGMMQDMENMPTEGRGQMGRMMQGMKGMHMHNMPMGSRGQLTVIQSGPGYHKERTYNFGPGEGHLQENGEGEEEKEKLLDNDMMNKPNPLERNDISDVEVIGDEKQPPSSSPRSFWDEMSRIRTQLEQQIQKLVNSDPEELERNSATVHGFDYDDFDTPKMSEGLRPGVRYLTREEFCSQSGGSMRWSDWVSCLHLRIGLPRWLTAATLSLGIIFIIWLCLVIPHSAPKQRVMKMPDHLTKTKLSILEATAIPGAIAKDAPPAYDDIAELHVAIPASEGDEAGPLPIKKPIGKDAEA